MVAGTVVEFEAFFTIRQNFLINMLELEYHKVVVSLNEDFPVKVETVMLFIGAGAEFVLPPSVAKFRSMREVKTEEMAANHFDWMNASVRLGEALRIGALFNATSENSASMALLRQGNQL